MVSLDATSDGFEVVLRIMKDDGVGIKGETDYHRLSVEDALRLKYDLERSISYCQDLIMMAKARDLQFKCKAQHIWKKGQQVVVVGGEDKPMICKVGTVEHDSMNTSPYWTNVCFSSAVEDHIVSFRSEELRLYEKVSS